MFLQLGSRYPTDGFDRDRCNRYRDASGKLHMTLWCASSRGQLCLEQDSQRFERRLLLRWWPPRALSHIRQLLAQLLPHWLKNASVNKKKSSNVFLVLSTSIRIGVCRIKEVNAEIDCTFDKRDRRLIWKNLQDAMVLRNERFCSQS